MSNDSDRAGGSDLDIFEGLGKKTPERSPAAPPPPPGSASKLPSARSVPLDAKRTLLGIPEPATLPASQPPVPPSPATRPSSTPLVPPPSKPPASGAMLSAKPSYVPPPPPPPGRGSLPELAKTTSQPALEAQGPQSASAAPPASVRLPAAPASPAAASASNGAKLEMDWDDDNEATHIFDKDKEKISPEASGQALTALEPGEPERANLDAIISSPPPRRGSSLIPAATPAAGTPPPSATLSGASDHPDALSAKGRSVPPLSAPPPRSSPPSTSKSPVQASLPPPPPGQVTTAPMHMPPSQGPMSVSPQASATVSSHPSGHPSGYPSASLSAIPSAPPVPNLPPVSRAMEATHVTARPASKAPLAAALLAVMGLAGVGVYSFMPRSGTLVVNVADTKGGAVSNLEVLIDGTKRCESAPCIVRDVPSGVREVKVIANGYELAAPRAVTVDGRQDVTTDFQLVPAKLAAGTGFKVAASSPDIKLTVDGKEVGFLPQEVRDIEPGEHTLRFVGDRYLPLEKTISVGKDEIVDLGTVNLKVAKGKATIQLGTPGAKVYLVNGTNRKEVPQFPMAIEFEANEQWELQATKEGHDDYRERISFDDGRAEKTFLISLAPKGSSTPAPTPVALAPVTAKEAPAPKAKTPAADTSKKDAPAGQAMLKINSLPASSIILDGKPIGVTPQLNVPVSPGTHTIMFVNAEQSLKKTITVDVKAGETKPAFAKLRD